MPETDNPRFYKNFQFDLTQLRLDIFRLSCYFLASPRLEEIICQTAKRNEDTEIIENPLLDVESQFFSEEVGRILLQTAVFVRAVLDEYESDHDQTPLLASGILLTEKGENPLSLREACNKIIHSQHVNYDHDPVDDPICEPGARNPIMYLYGSTQSGKQWKATLQILDFAQNSIRVLRHRYLSDYISDPNYESSQGP